VTARTWEAPGPGLWRRDDPHQAAPMTNYLWHFIEANFNVGIEEASRRYGMLLERFDMAIIEGWW
jgi:hypothetical protein